MMFRFLSPWTRAVLVELCDELELPICDRLVLFGIVDHAIGESLVENLDQYRTKHLPAVKVELDRERREIFERFGRPSSS